MDKFNLKIITAGNTIEIIKFGKPVYNKADENVIRLGRKAGASEQDKLLNRYRIMKRARTDIRRLVQANNAQWFDSRGKPYKSVFMTLTFAENIQDFDTANHEFKLFIMRLGNLVGSRKNQNCLKYIVVPEFQKRGAIHYHVVFFNLRYIPAKTIHEIWRNGFIKINAIEQIDNVGAYICKYLGKDLDDDRLRGKKSYFSSRGLYKPIVVKLDLATDKDKKILEQVLHAAQDNAVKPPYIAVHKSDYYDIITYTQFTLKEQIDTISQIKEDTAI